jgi:hypothetical protein
MSESDILQRMFDAIASVLTVFSIFFTLVSAYLAGLYLFIGRAPFALRALAFGLLSVGFVFLGGTAAVIGRLQDGLFVAWQRIGTPVVAIGDLRNPLPVPEPIMAHIAAAGLSQQQLGVLTGWAVALAVYLALFYLTFLYRWPAADPPR